jgi:hypothetical protein
VLSTQEAVARRLFARMREADELDELFLGQCRTGWEGQLFNSAYGRAFVQSCVLPAVSRSYSVAAAARPAGDPIRALLVGSPTAARLSLEFRPAPGNLAKEYLLRCAVVTGALYDLHANPNLLLQRGFRQAVRDATRSDRDAALVLRLIEELALVGGFSVEQLMEAHRLSEGAREGLEDRAAGRHTSLTISQTLPADSRAGHAGLPSLLLASQRARTPIRLAQAAGHALAVRLEGDSAALGSLPPEDPVMVEFSPDTEGRGPAFLPAHIEVLADARTIRLRVSRYEDSVPAPYPFLARLPPPPPGERVPTRPFQVGVSLPNLSVRDVLTLGEASNIVQTAGARIELVSEDSGRMFASLVLNETADYFGIADWDPDVFRGLQGADGSLPFPVLLSQARLAEFGRLPEPERASEWEQLRRSAASDPPTVCSVYVRISNEVGAAALEEFLCFLPRLPISPPILGEGAPMDQTTFEAHWRAGTEEFTITAYFETDVLEMARLLRAWCLDPSTPFPFSFNPDAISSPLTRTFATIHLPRVIDRVWHRERPVVFEFRPIDRAESYELEAGYWRSQGDNARAELAEEIRDRLQQAADRAANVPDHTPQEGVASTA